MDRKEYMRNYMRARRAKEKGKEYVPPVKEAAERGEMDIIINRLEKVERTVEVLAEVLKDAAARI